MRSFGVLRRFESQHAKQRYISLTSSRTRLVSTYNRKFQRERNLNYLENKINEANSGRKATQETSHVCQLLDVSCRSNDSTFAHPGKR